MERGCQNVVKRKKDFSFVFQVFCDAGRTHFFLLGSLRTKIYAYIFVKSVKTSKAKNIIPTYEHGGGSIII